MSEPARDAAGTSWTTVGSATYIIATSALALADSLEVAIERRFTTAATGGIAR